MSRFGCRPRFPLDKIAKGNETKAIAIAITTVPRDTMTISSNGIITLNGEGRSKLSKSKDISITVSGDRMDFWSRSNEFGLARNIVWYSLSRSGTEQGSIVIVVVLPSQKNLV